MLIELRGERCHRKQEHRIVNKNSQLLMLLWRISRCNMLAKILEIATIFSYLQHQSQLLLTKALLCGYINQTLSASNFLSAILSEENV